MSMRPMALDAGRPPDSAENVREQLEAFVDLYTPFIVALLKGFPRAAKATVEDAKPTKVAISPDALETMFQVAPPSAEQYTPSVAPCPNCVCAAARTIDGFDGFTAT